MKITAVDGTTAQSILAHLLQVPGVCGEIATWWPENGAPGYFADGGHNLLAGWAVSYWRKYGAAPGLGTIAARLQQYAEAPDTNDDNLRILIQAFEALGDARLPEGYVLETARQYFNTQHLSNLQQKTQVLIEDNRGEEAAALMVKAAEPLIPSLDNIPAPLVSRDALSNLIEQPPLEPLITFEADHSRRGHLKQFFRNVFCREQFVTFMGPEKRGKSFFMLDLARRAVQEGRHVLYYSIGDMSRNEVYLRLLSMLLHRPIQDDVVKHIEDIDYKRGEIEIINSRHEVMNGFFPNDKKAMREASQAWLSLPGTCAFEEYPMSTVSAKDLLHTTARFMQYNPLDIVIIDYADTLVNPVEGRDGYDQTWKTLRGMTQQLKILGITATQTSIDARHVRWIGPQHFSEDKRKLAHATAAIGLNASQQEEQEGLIRLNIPINRWASKYLHTGPAVVTNWKTGQAAVSYTFPNNFEDF